MPIYLMHCSVRWNIGVCVPENGLNLPAQNWAYGMVCRHLSLLSCGVNEIASNSVTHQFCHGEARVCSVPLKIGESIILVFHSTYTIYLYASVALSMAPFHIFQTYRHEEHSVSASQGHGGIVWQTYNIVITFNHNKVLEHELVCRILSPRHKVLKL